jgi:peptidoglycan/LPS O-acetylase OafA/YrhL
MSSPFAVATLRGVFTAVITFISVALTAYQTQTVPHNWSDAIVSGGVAAMAVLLARVGLEGSYDQSRAVSTPPAVTPGDVGGH